MGIDTWILLAIGFIVLVIVALIALTVVAFIMVAIGAASGMLEDYPPIQPDPKKKL